MSSTLTTWDGELDGALTTRNGAVPLVRSAARPPTVVRLTEWAEAAQAAYSVAQKLVTTSFVPEVFRDKPHEATAAILAGDEVGLSPMASLRAFDIIDGVAAPRAITHRAVVQSFGHEVWQVEATNTRAVIRGRRAGTNQVQESEWTIERARLRGLTGKKNWREQPKSMLIARATSEVCRLIASDAIMGMPYSVEELMDDRETGGDTAAPPVRTVRRRSRSVTPPPGEVTEPQGPPLPGEDTPLTTETEGDAPTIVDADTDDGGGVSPVEMITKEQLRKLHTVFTSANVTDRDTRLTTSGLIIGRDVESSTDLTKAEASRLLTWLEDASDRGALAEDIAELVGRADENQE
jgi:hypothetical protein